MRIEDRIRAELQAQGSSLRVPGGDLRTVLARGTAQRRGKLAVAVGSAAIVVVAAIVGGGMLLSGGDETPVATGDTVTTTSAASASTTSPAPTTTSTTTAPPPPPALDAIIVATPDGIVAVRDGEIADRVPIGPVMSAFDDLAGGHVVQIGASASSILHLPTGADELEEIIAATTETLTLHDVVPIDGSATVVYTSRRSGVSPQEAREELRVYDIATGEDRVIAQVGGYESGASQVSYADGRFVVTMNAEGLTWFEAYGPAGEPVDFPGNPRTEAQSADDFLVWMGVGALAGDGQTFAYLKGSPRSEAPFRFVVVGVPSGEQLLEVPVGGVREDDARHLSWDGETAVISVTGEPAVVIRAGTVVGRLPVAGIADLAGPGD